MITVNRKEFIRALQWAGLAVSRKKHHEDTAFGHVLVEVKGREIAVIGRGTYLTGDTDVYVPLTRIGTWSKLDNAARFTVPFRATLERAKASDHEVISFALMPGKGAGKPKVETKTGGVRQVSDNLEGDIAGDPPALGPLPVSFEAKVLVDALNRVIPAASTDDARPVLNAVQLEIRESTVSMVAADGFRLVREVIPADISYPRTKILIRRATAEIVAKIAASSKAKEIGLYKWSLPVGANPGFVFLIGGNEIGIKVSAPEEKGTYPDYLQIIPKKSKIMVTAGRDALIDALDRAAKIAKKDGTVLRVGITQKAIQLRLPDLDNPDRMAFEAEIPAQNDGADILIAFNPAFLHESIRGALGAEVKIGLTSPNSPALITGANHYQAVVMPMHLG